MVKHTVEGEELQAYLDGELDAARQAEIERHLAGCPECLGLVADLKRVSETLQRWQVEPAPARLRPPAVEAERPARRWTWPQVAIAFGGAAAVLLLAFATMTPNLLRSRMSTEQAEKATGLSGPVQPTPSSPPQPPPGVVGGTGSLRAAKPAASSELQAHAEEKLRNIERQRAAQEGRRAEAADEMAADRAASAPSSAGALSAPAAKRATATVEAPAKQMIAYDVWMTVQVEKFEDSKQKLLQLVEASGAYVAESSSADTPNAPRRADLVVRVPAEKLQSFLGEARGLGRVLNEQLSSDEVTDQVVDLEARLRNARATEEWLIAVLKERTGKVRDILDVEREIARTREDIERMEAQRQNLMHRVELATVHFSLVEEFKAQLQPAPLGTSTRLRNAFVEGYENLAAMLLALAFFFARYGLVLVFWCGLVWLLWRAFTRPLRRLTA